MSAVQLSRSASTSSVETAALLDIESNASATSPFGLPTDPSSLAGSVFTSAQVLVSSVAYSITDRLFSYAAPGSDSSLDAALQLWKTFKKANTNGVVPEVSRFEVRSGASSAVLGYLSNYKSKNPISLLVPGSALPFMQPILASKNKNELPLAFNVAAIDYDEESSALVSDYITPLSVARNLGYSVVTPMTPLEAQHMTLLASYVASYEPIFNLYDGPAFLKDNGKIDGVLSPLQLSKAYASLKTQNFDVSQPDRISTALTALNNALGTSYKSFEYAGSASPAHVFVAYGSSEAGLLLKTVTKLANAGVSVGAIAVRVPLPFNVAEFAAAVPASTRTVTVFTQQKGATSSSLKADVTAALFLTKGAAAPQISEYKYSTDFVFSYSSLTKVLGSFVVIPETFSGATGESYTFWSPDNGALVNVGSKLSHSFSLDTSSGIHFRAKYDNVAGAGTLVTSISSEANTSVDSASVLIVEGVNTLESFDVIETARQGATVILATTKKIEDIAAFADSLPATFRRQLAKRSIKLIVLDLEAVGEHEQTSGFTASIAAQVAFWHFAFPSLSEHDVVLKVWQAAGSDAELLASVISDLRNKVLETGIKEITVDKEWATLPFEEDEVALPYYPVETSFEPNPRTVDVAQDADTQSILEISKKLTFKEAYGTKTSLRPDLPVRNFVVKVKENKRVTPEDYSRNIFEIEFDITGTGLTYDIGEALGIHGRNDPLLVQEFLDMYGLEGESLIDVPSKDDHHIIETRTVFQAFAENLDLLGKPPKRFYESLASFATNEDEQKKLEFVASAEGAAELKKFQEEETYSYSDIFELFPSARPSVGELVQLIAPLKRREYSIASSQRMHPNAVHLLIVVVDWIDKKGRKRYGHCSHYLSELAVGTELVVSVKPSVMKLPPLSTQPVIMSGLGTGLAPFKAIVEEKVWQKAQGMEIGSIYLYLGSRHKKEEYLYGELWEAYKDAGIITHIGAAFSRDQPEKIYIQDRIRENIEELATAVADENGSFYLCGPTWPVPDITACLEDIVSTDAARRNVQVDAAKEVEEMKETGRYILEVY